MKRDEIKQYFIDKKEEITCGRFTVSQLSQNPLPNINRSFLSRFAFVLYVVFGMTLFSCAQNNNDPHVMGKVAPNYSQKDTLKIKQLDTLSTSDSLIITPKSIEPTIMGAAVIDKKEYLLGEPAIYIEEKKLPKEKQKSTIKMGDFTVED